MKSKLPLQELITTKKLENLRKEYNNPAMTKQDAYKKVIVVNNYLEALKSFTIKTK